MAATKRKEGYIHVGDVLRDALLEDIGSIAWDGDMRLKADKVKSALQRAAPHRGGYLLDISDWTQGDVDFLQMEIASVIEDEGHSFMSHGVALGGTRIGRQIRALREKLEKL